MGPDFIRKRSVDSRNPELPAHLMCAPTCSNRFMVVSTAPDAHALRDYLKSMGAGKGQSPFVGTLNKSIQQLRELGTGERGVPATFKINSLEQLILAVRLCTVEAVT